VTLALVDGDIAAYRASTAEGEIEDWENERFIPTPLTLAQARSAGRGIVNEWVDLAGCDDVIVALTGKEKWRKRILPSYQANRGTRARPANVDLVKAALADSFRSHLIEGLEADDILGILATTPKYADHVVISSDKDLRTVPGIHFNPLKDSFPLTISEPEANYQWMYQTLIGDATDGYTGLPGIGPVKAVKILPPVGASLKQLWQAVYMAYRKADLSPAQALTQARVARILRREDYDKNTKEIILWHLTDPVRIPVLLSSTSTEVKAA
jgi:DNA polymerase-1